MYPKKIIPDGFLARTNRIREWKGWYRLRTQISAKIKTGQVEIFPACPAKSGRLDSNQRPLTPHASALPGCATPRLGRLNFSKDGFEHQSKVIQNPIFKKSMNNTIFAQSI